MAERLQKFLARAGVSSRRKAEALIRAGQVSVNGAIAQLGSSVSESDEVRLDGKRIVLPSEHVSYALYKPKAVLSSVSDDRGRPTVMALVPAAPGLHPVGRLDFDSEGLLILTTDGDLTLHLSHPRYGHRKVYRVWCAEGSPDSAALAALRKGVMLEDGLARAVHSRAAAGGCVLVLQDGRKRQVRRMMAALGYRVTRLLRTHIAELSLAGLRPGGYRRLEPADMRALAYPQQANPSRRRP